MRYHIYLQCRMNSTRLPNKILYKILGHTILDIIYQRLYKIAPIKVVSGDNEENLRLIPEANPLNMDCFFGDENNLVKRFREAKEWFGTENIIRVTGDNPMIDPDIIRKAIKVFDCGRYDFLELVHYPKGVLFEIFKASALDEISDKEHLTVGLKKLDRKYIMNPDRRYRPELDVEINTEEDYERVRKLFEMFNNIRVPFKYVADFY